MNKSLLKQALKFNDNLPTYSQIEKLYKKVMDYQSENDVYFIKAKRGSRAEILNEQEFFDFVSEELVDKYKVKSFEDIEKILNAKTRQENIEATGNSKNSIVRVFEKVVVFQKDNNNPVLYKNMNEIEVNCQIVAVENGETFLNIYPIMSKFGFNNFVYLGGFSNSLTREFLKNKDVVFFLDYDIEAIRIYDSFECAKKSFFVYPDLEDYFKENGNQELYLKQMKNSSLPEKHSELQWLIKLIDTYSAVVEQEIFT